MIAKVFFDSPTLTLIDKAIEGPDDDITCFGPCDDCPLVLGGNYCSDCALMRIQIGRLLLT